MVIALLVSLSFCVGWILAGLFYSRSESAAVEELRARVEIVEGEQAQRELLVADAVSKITTASKRIQQRFRDPAQLPSSPPNGESTLSLRNRLK